jgi:signal transduction histidine kinase
MRLDGRGLTVQAAREQRPILENDVYSNSTYWDGSNNLTRSELAVPMLIDHDQLWGVLNVEKEIKDGFTEEDKETLTALANLALAAVQSDEYYTDIQRAKNVQAISHVLLLIIHRLNNQISLIPVEAAMALDEIKNSSLSTDQSKGIRKHLRKIIKNGREITNQILEIYRPFTSPLESVSLSAICRELEKSVDLPSNVNLSISPDPNVGEVLASRVTLFMILENMLQNSISQLPEGGRIWIKSEPIDAEWAQVHIYDNGVGIPPDKLRKLSRFSIDFDAKQLNEPRSHKGLGLGLSLAYWFIKRLGGDLQIESRVTEIDHCTRITIKLPRSVERQWNRLGPLMDSHEI